MNTQSIAGKMDGIGLRGKVVGFFAFFVVATGVMVLITARHDARRAMENGLSQRAVFMAKSLADRSGDALASGDIESLERMIADVSAGSDVVFAAVARADGSIMAQRVPEKARSYLAAAYDVKSDGSTVVVRSLRVADFGEITLVAAPVIVRGKGSKPSSVGEIRLGLSMASATATLRAMVWRGVALILAALCLGIAATLFSAGRVLAPIEKMALLARRIATGDFRQEGDGGSGHGLGLLGEECSTMTANLRTMVSNLQVAYRDVIQAAEDIYEDSKKLTEGTDLQQVATEKTARSVDHMNGSFKEIASGVSVLSGSVDLASSSILELSASIGEVAGSTSGLSSAVDDTSSSIIQMATSIKEVADHAGALSAASQETASAVKEISASVQEVEERAREAARVSEKVTSDAEELGVKSIEKTIEGMKLIKGNIDQAESVVNRLGERSEHIGKVLTVVEEVTKQTNLLALNAAILAAQAGEHGKGFSVVAGEIKKLSNRTTASTNEIVELITAIQKETKDAVAVIHDGASSAESGMKLAAEAGNALKKLLDGARRSTTMALAIEGTTVEQAKGISQVAESVERVSVMSQQIETATQEQRKGTDLIMQTAERMRDITRRVKMATEEQAKGSRQITGEVESVTGRVQAIARALDELRSESGMISEAIEEIRSASRRSVELPTQMSSAVEGLKKQAQIFEQDLSHFRV